MNPWSELGKVLIILGCLLVVIGIGLKFFSKFPFIGRLPGDIVFERPGFKIYFPWVTCLVLSIILSLIFYFWRK